MKKTIALLLVLVSMFLLAACGEQKILRIYCWNNEFQTRFEDYYSDLEILESGQKVEWVITPSEDNAYQNALDEALANQEDLPENERIDMFLVEADYALKYVNTDYTLDVIKDVGLTAEDMKEQYQYTKDIVTDDKGALKGTTWQATPGLFAYRRSIATEVLGSDNPDTVQTFLSDWDKFNAVAEDMKEKNYYMLSGYDDAYRPFANNINQPWVNANKEIVIDDNLFDWVDQTKDFTDKGYNQKTSLWDTEWAAGQGPDGKVFGYFYSTWGINFTLLGNSLEDANAEAKVGNGIFGDWAVCEGPASYYWGGTWICAAKGTDDIETVKDIMLKLTCDKATMKKITEETQDFTNNEAAMTEIANSTFKSDFLGGQNHIKLFVEAAKKIDMSNISPYDQGMTEEFQSAFKDYFDGNATREQALANFYTAIKVKYPGLKEPD